MKPAPPQTSSFTGRLRRCAPAARYEPARHADRRALRAPMGQARRVGPLGLEHADRRGAGRGAASPRCSPASTVTSRPPPAEHLARQLVPAHAAAAGHVHDARTAAARERRQRGCEVAGPGGAAELVGDHRDLVAAAVGEPRASCRRSCARPRRTATPCARSRVAACRQHRLLAGQLALAVHRARRRRVGLTYGRAAQAPSKT